MSGIFTEVAAWYMEHMNYYSIAALMAIESSFIPFPSEIIVPPAAYKAAQGGLNIYLVILSASLGAVVGALFNYYLALWLGRGALYAFARTRFARMCLVDTASVQKAENYFVRHGRSSTFIGRLIPGIRQLISLPAGLARMPLKSFIFYTTLGVVIWNTILALLGFYIPPKLVETYYHELSYIMLGLGLLFVLYLLYKGFVQKQEKEQSPR